MVAHSKIELFRIANLLQMFGLSCTSADVRAVAETGDSYQLADGLFDLTEAHLASINLRLTGGLVCKLSPGIFVFEQRQRASRRLRHHCRQQRHPQRGPRRLPRPPGRRGQDRHESYYAPGIVLVGC